MWSKDGNHPNQTKEITVCQVPKLKPVQFAASTCSCPVAPNKPCNKDAVELCPWSTQVVTRLLDSTTSLSGQWHILVGSLIGCWWCLPSIISKLIRVLPPDAMTFIIAFRGAELGSLSLTVHPHICLLCCKQTWTCVKNTRHFDQNIKSKSVPDYHRPVFTGEQSYHPHGNLKKFQSPVMISKNVWRRFMLLQLWYLGVVDICTRNQSPSKKIADMVCRAHLHD